MRKLLLLTLLMIPMPAKADVSSDQQLATMFIDCAGMYHALSNHMREVNNLDGALMASNLSRNSLNVALDIFRLMPTATPDGHAALERMAAFTETEMTQIWYNMIGTPNEANFAPARRTCLEMLNAAGGK